jgi:large subunit ribosomal protein L32
MAMPKTKTNRSHAGNRRASYYRKGVVPTVTTCQTCGAPKRSHRVCAECGSYTNGKGETLRVFTVED